MNFWLITNGIAAWLLPPGCLLLLGAYACWRCRRHPHVGIALWVFTLCALWILSMPWFSIMLLRTLEPAASDPLRAAPAQAIVVLGGGQYHAAPEYGADTANGATLVRLQYAAYLHRQTGKPILVSGGSPEGSNKSEAQLMKAVLENDFRTAVSWAEAGSNNTQENARASRALLAPLGINRIYLVTHAWHMPRAHHVFRAAGFDVVPAPTQFATRFRLTALDFMPQAYALHNSSHYFHEIVGLAWYRIKSAVF